MYNIIGKRNLWYIISAIAIIPGLISLMLYGLKLGIDFKGGTLLEIKFPDKQTVNTEEVRDSLKDLNLGNLTIQSSGANQVIIRTDTLTVDNTTTTKPTNTENQIIEPDTTPAAIEKDQTKATDKTSFLINKAFAQTETDQTNTSSNNVKTVNVLGGTEQYNQIIQKLEAKFGTVKELRFEAIGPTISNELAQKTIWAVLLASLAIILYLAWAFRNVPAPTSSWRFGICAIAALLHDVLFVLGVYSILGHFYNVEIDILFLPAILTVMSFSVHDSIVVFDRIRENLRKYSRESFEEVVNISINETLVRSLNVSLTVVVTLLALYLFGAESIKPFLLTLIIGLISGTYSSIFNASPLLVSWHYWTSKK
jgi:preprotein translocase subunit SecF